MNRDFIDLSVPMEYNEGEISDFEFKQIGHAEGGNIFGKNFAFSRKLTLKATIKSIFGYISGKRRITSSTFPDNEFINMETITASTHTGTHLDAPLHFGPVSEGKAALSVDKIPLEWCFGHGILLDLTFKNPGEFIQVEDIQKALQKIDYRLKPFDIVLIRTGADRYWGTKEYLTNYPGMSREATEYIVSHGIKMIGIDSYSFDRPFINMMNDYFQTGDSRYLFPAHFFGRERSYCHIERLTNLDKIPIPYGFQLCCFPIRIKEAGAAWTRVVAII